MSLEISITETKKGVFQFLLKGMLNTDTYDKLEKATKEILPNAIAMVFDLSGLTYISSMGLRTLAVIRKTMAEKQCSFMLVNPQPSVKMVLDVTTILSDSLISSLEEADTVLDTYLDQIQKGEIKPRLPSHPQEG